MSKIGMTRNIAKAAEVPDSSIEEQLNLLHDNLDTLDYQMDVLREKLSEVLCSVSDKSVNAVPEIPVMSPAAERIFTAQRRVCDQVLVIEWLNENLNIKNPSLAKGDRK